VLEEAHDSEELIQRVAALDIGKAQLVCCVGVPDPDRPGKRLQEVRTYPTMTRSLLAMADRLGALGVSRVVMEATSDYWKAPFYLLEAHGFEVWLVNAKDVKHLPGRPKTDRLDAVWLAKVAERQMLGPSFVPPPAIRRLRDLTRYRADLVAGRTAEKQRVEKLLEDAQIKLSVVASDIFGVSGRAMLAGLIAGERDPRSWPCWRGPAYAPSAASWRRPSVAASATITPSARHHAWPHRPGQRRHRRAGVHIEAEITPFQVAADRLDEITGVGRTAAQVIIAEIGVDMSRFPTPGHLVSWARFAPGVKESAGRRKGNATTGHGNPYLARVLGEAAVAAGRTNTFLGERYRRIARRRGAKRAIVAVGRSILIIVWHLLSDPTVRYQDLGPGFYDTRINAERRKRNHIRQLEALGYKVTLEPAA
jgi:transposase